MKTQDTSLTNNVLYLPDKNSYYLPARVRLKFKTFKEINVEQNVGSMYATLVISIYYQGLSKCCIEALKKKLVINFNIDNPVLLSSKQDQAVVIKHNEDQKEIDYFYRGTFYLYIISDSFKFPIQNIQLVFTVNLLKIYVYQNDKEYTLRFNIMDLEPNGKNDQQIKVDNGIKLSFSEMMKFGNFKLVKQSCGTVFTNDFTPKVIILDNIKSSKDQKQSFVFQNIKSIISLFTRNQNQSTNSRQLKLSFFSFIRRFFPIKQNELVIQKSEPPKNKLKEFQYAHFIYQVTKFTKPTIPLIFFPLLIIALVNIFIFSQNKGKDKVAQIVGILMALSALIPVIRSQVQSGQIITGLEQVVILLSLVSFACIIDCFVKQGLIHDLLYFISKVITFGCLAIIFWLFFYSKQSPNQDEKDWQIVQQKTKQRSQWSNKKCDQMFDAYKGKIFNKSNPSRKSNSFSPKRSSGKNINP